MPPPAEYVDREQTFAKHLLFEFYLETLAYHILSFKDEFVYVDGFSGPWESKDAGHADTSFAIAIRKLSEVREGAGKAFKKSKRIRCLFIEKDRQTFDRLEAYVKKTKTNGIEIKLLNGDFEDLIEPIQQFIGSSFGFIFVDPTGWTAYAFDKIKPLFQSKGEFLINFMYNYVRRFIEDDRDNIKSGFERLFGGGNWEAELDDLRRSGMSDEQAIVELYCRRLRSISAKLRWAVTYTPISHPQKDRSWFYLIYATTHLRGLEKFHEIEEKALKRYGEIRQQAIYEKKAARTGQDSLFGHTMEKPTAYPLDRLQEQSLRMGPVRILERLKRNGRQRYSELAFEILQMPLVGDKLLRSWLVTLRDKGTIALDGLQPRGGVKDDTTIYLTHAPGAPLRI
jgi:three-Cys-motif partner protein